MSETKCEKGGMCEMLSQRISDSGRGFRAINTVNPVTAVATFQGVAYKTKASDRGLMLNFCPFCGGMPGVFERTEDIRRACG